MSFDNITTWKRARSANTTSNAWPGPLPTTTAPTAGDITGGAVINLDTGSGQVKSILQLIIFGAGSDNNTTAVRVYGWSLVQDASLTAIYMPTLLADFTATLSSTVIGVSGAAVKDTDLIADTLSLATGFNSNTSVEFTSPGGDSANISPALAQIDLKGHSLIEIDFNRGSSATNSNAIYRVLG